MIVMGTCKTSPELGYLYALAKSISKTGTEVGDFICTKIRDKEYKCEITDKKDGKFHLVGLGWIDEKECYQK